MDPLTLLPSWPAANNQAGWATRNAAQITSDDPYMAFELASVTKALFSLAVLVAYEEGTVSLTDVVAENGATVSNLLSHSSGLGAEVGNPEVARVGEKRAYSNQGFELLAKHLEGQSGMSAQQYFAEAVAEPLGMSRTEIYGSVAKEGRSCVADLLTFGAELLRPSLISHDTIRKASSPHLPALVGVLPGFGHQNPNSWGLGFEIKGTKTNHWMASDNSPGSFGHFGQAGTFLWVDPLAEMCCVALSDLAFGEWAKQAWPEFSQAVLDVA